MPNGMKFNPPPGWPPPPEDWTPTSDWRPDPSWPPAPQGWVFWVPDDTPDRPPAPAQTEPPTAPPVGPPVTQPTPTAASVGQQPTQPDVEEPAAAASAAGRHSAGRTRSRSPDPHDTAQPFVEPTPTERPTQQTAPIEPTPQTRPKEVRQEVRDERVRASTADATPATAAGGGAALLAADIAAARRQLIELNDAVLLQQVGIYEYHHPLENADAYKDRLASIRDRIKDAVRTHQAIEASDRFTYNNSLAQGRKMTADFSKLMLRAYNAEADNCVRSLRAGSIDAAKRRLDASVESIARLGSMMQMRVTPAYHSLRIEELELTSDYLFMVQEEREKAREEREQLREQRKAEQELAAERERLEKERQHYLNALDALRANEGQDAAEGSDLARHLANIQAAIAQNDYRVANIRAGYVYVISNVGAFGTRVVKIGMTRRLDPMDRVRELGDASVPFPFDVHALYFSDDAVALEAQLHAAFADRRLNQVKLRREFFFATPTELRDVLKNKVGNLLEFTEEPDATQYHQSQSAWPQDLAAPAPLEPASPLQ
jgi:hypothetical protein